METRGQYNISPCLCGAAVRLLTPRIVVNATKSARAGWSRMKDQSGAKVCWALNVRQNTCIHVSPLVGLVCQQASRIHSRSVKVFGEYIHLAYERYKAMESRLTLRDFVSYITRCSKGRLEVVATLSR